MARDNCLTLPRGAMGLSPVYDCGNSGSYSLTIFQWDISDLPFVKNKDYQN